MRSVDVVRISRAVPVPMAILPLIVVFGKRNGPPLWRDANSYLVERVTDFTSST